MIQTTCYFRRRLGLLGLLLVVLTPFPGSLSGQGAAPNIQITGVPPAKQGNPTDMFRISGTVTGVQQPRDYAVIIYAFAADLWWVQPYDYQPKTAINDGKFQTLTHGGTAYAALLVRAGFKPEAKMPALPPEGGDIIKIASVDGK